MEFYITQGRPPHFGAENMTGQSGQAEDSQGASLGRAQRGRHRFLEPSQA